MEPIPEENTQSTQPQRIEISPLQLLVNAVFLAYQRGVYTMKEAGIISQAIDFFTIETKQAIIPVPQSNGSEPREQTETSSVKSDKLF